MKKYYYLAISFCLTFASKALAANSTYSFTNDSGLKPLGNKAGYNTVTAPKSPQEMIGSAILVIISFIGVIFLVQTIYAGFYWMSSQGNEEKIKKAKGSLSSAIIGLGIVALAYIISYFAIKLLTDKYLK